MTPTEFELWLRSGITAVKAGNKAKAQQHFLKIIEVDDQNELAWLWLSTAVSTKEDKITCLENVLTINPQNKKAQIGLARLQKQDTPPTTSENPRRQTVRREYKQSGAGAILYPERAVQEWEWVDNTKVQPGKEVGYLAHTQYDDVWTGDADLCAYCAALLEETEQKCPQCGRVLVTKQYRYPHASSRVPMFWVGLFGLANINLVQLFHDYVFWNDIGGVVVNGVLVLLFTLLGTGAMMRRAFSFYGGQILTIIVLLIGILETIYPVRLHSNRLPEFDPAIARFVGGLGAGFDQFLNGFELVGAALVLGLAIFFLAPDFEQVSLRKTAMAKKGLPNGADYYLEGKRAAEAGLWGTAVLNWQRAASLEPTRLPYQQRLADAYARLNFFQRSLDVLQSSMQWAATAAQKKQIQKQIDHIQAIANQKRQD